MFMRMEKNSKIFNVLNFMFDTVIYAIAYMFLIVFTFSAIYFICHLAMQDIVVRYYICGLLCIIAAGLSILTVENYNKKYSKNDSDSSKRQNDYLFEGDIRREEERYSDRRGVE